MVYVIHQNGIYYWFYLHSPYCFRKDANSNYCFTCGFDTGPIAAVTAAAEKPHNTYVPEVLAHAYVPAGPTNNVAEIFACTTVPEVLEIDHMPEVFLLLRSPVLSSVTCLAFSNHVFRI